MRVHVRHLPAYVLLHLSEVGDISCESVYHPLAIARDHLNHVELDGGDGDRDKALGWYWDMACCWTELLRL